MVGTLVEALVDAHKVQQGHGVWPWDLHALLEVHLDFALNGEQHVAGILDGLPGLVCKLLGKTTNL
jgi:hypothetical protein